MGKVSAAKPNGLLDPQDPHDGKGRTDSRKLSSDLGKPVMTYASQLPIHYLLNNKIFKNSKKQSESGQYMGSGLYSPVLSMSKDTLSCYKMGEGMVLLACSG